jgi:peptide subunit release factor RF-3
VDSGQHIQTKGSEKYKQGKCKTDSDWSESEEDKVDSGQRTV